MRTETVWAAGGVLSWLAISLCAGLALAADISPPADTMSVPAAASSFTRLSGTFEVTGTLLVSAGLPNGTKINANANAQVSDTVYFGNVSVQGVSPVTGGKVSFKLQMPYTWLVKSTADTVSVQLNLTGSAFGSGTTDSFSYSTFLTKTISLPKNGATTPVTFTGSL